MDKKSLIGLGLIAIILGVWLWKSGPTPEQLAARKRAQDSIENVKQQALANELAAKRAAEVAKDTLKTTTVLSDSAKQVMLASQYRDFAPASKGTQEFFVIENEKIKATINNKGAFISKLELKEHHRSGKTKPLVLFEGDSARFAIALMAFNDRKKFYTDEFYFTKINSTSTQLKMRLQTTSANSYIEFTYSLKPNDYIVDADVAFVGMDKIITSNEDQLQLLWNMHYPSQEKYISKEKQVATIHYKQVGLEVDDMSPMKDERKDLNDADIKWVCFKQQYFNATLIAKSQFEKAGSTVQLGMLADSKTEVKAANAELGIKYNHQPSETFKYQFYFGPNHYNTLGNYDLELEKIIPTGWSLFSYINKGLVIPLFNWLSSLNMGIVILILTIIIKIVLLPIAYKTYMSGARMRVLKPEIDALNEKFGKNADPMKKQQEQMALYRKAGVNPLSGCLPMLLQFPLLIALFAFIPAAFELRQKAFLWADDLSTYDSIWTFGEIPVINSIYGDHVSLFAALMFVSTIIYTYMNSNLMPQQNNQMPGMKVMMYLMPLIFLSVMNSYAAGLSWYYFLANMVTFLQNYLFKFVISDSKIRLELEANMKKPQKKGGFAARLEQMAKQRQAEMNKKKK